jgi:hypothetical protein
MTWGIATGAGQGPQLGSPFASEREKAWVTAREKAWVTAREKAMAPRGVRVWECWTDRAMVPVMGQARERTKGLGRDTIKLLLM